MAKIIKTGLQQSRLMLAMIVLIMLTGSTQAANVFNSAPFQQRNLGHISSKNILKKPVYRYVVNTSKKARRQGKVNASGIIWNCKNKRCTTKGPWPKPSVAACQKLAKLVGPIRSYGRARHYLSKRYIRQCNRKFARYNKKIINTRNYTKTNLTKRNMAPRLSNRERQRARLFFARLPVDRVIKAKLSRGRDVRYLVVTNALSGRSHQIERRIWTGKILLPDLKRKGKVKPIRFIRKRHNGTRSRKMTAWFIENPDRSLSRQIRNSRGKLAGNITFTRDGSVRIGIDLNGDQIADLYETIISSGEHTILASPAGQAALEHFRNGGKNPLCNPGASGAGSTGGRFAGGMISGGDKTAMQITCGRSNNKPSNGGSGATTGGAGISGDPVGRATDAMCKNALSRRQGRPGNSGMVMDGPDLVGLLFDFLPLDPVTSTTITLYRDRDKSWQETVIDVGVGLLGPVGAFVDASAASSSGDDAATRTDFVNEDDRDIYAYEQESDHGDHPDLSKVKSACAAGSRSEYCGAWLKEHDNVHVGSGGNGGGNSGNNSLPGPDQQNDPNAAMLSFCQNRAKSKAWWASITKDTRYIRQLCENPASQPNPEALSGSAGKASSATLGDSYGSAVTLTTYCGQYGGQRTSASPSERLAGQGRGRNCGRTESPGADGKCHGVGTQFNGGSAGKVNVSYGAIIGIPLFDPRVTNPDPRY